jgi:predicted ATPase
VRALPSGTVTFLFSDIEGSTRLLEELGADRYAEALAEHRRVMREAFGAHGGVEVDTQGDAFFVAFPEAAGALAAAGDAQRALAAGPVSVRMGLHTGKPLKTAGGYIGIDVHRGARVMSAGHGGQVLVSDETYELLDGTAALTDLGLHRLKDLTEPQRLWQLGSEEFPPLKTLYQTNLPVQPTPLVGRESELAQVLGLLAEARLVTLTGAGGSGKTRLALQAAAELVDDYKDGVWWVSLAAIRDPELVEPTIAQAVGAKDGLAEHVRDQTTLLLLDNFEQLLDAALLVGTLLTEAPSLRVLATSRERLGVAGEQEYPVPTMVPIEALALFTARARQLAPAFEPDEATAEICRRLDGLPLAIELAAARIKVLRSAQILERLGRSLDLLTTGARDAPERQQTLRATIDWSYDLLDDAEQRLFAQLSVFAGSLDLQAAEAVCEADLDTLAALVDKSLLRRADDGRFFMLETIREYAGERRAEDPDAADIARRHAEHYLAIAESAGLSLEDVGRSPQRHSVVLREQQNLRAAIEWAAEADVALGLRLAIALENFWVTHDPAEGARGFEALLARAEGVDLTLRARALRDYGGCADMAGDYELAERLYLESGELFRQAGDPGGVATAEFRVGVIASLRDEVERARRLWERSLATFRRLGDESGELQALGNLGGLELLHGDRDHGRQLTERSLAMARRVGWVWWEVWMLLNLADAALVSGRPDEGARLARECLKLARQIEDRAGVVYGLALSAWAAAERDDAECAAALWSAVEAEEEAAPIPRWETERERYAPHIPERAESAPPLSLDEAVEQALAGGSLD